MLLAGCNSDGEIAVVGLEVVLASLGALSIQRSEGEAEEEGVQGVEVPSRPLALQLSPPSSKGGTGAGVLRVRSSKSVVFLY